MRSSFSSLVVLVTIAAAGGILASASLPLTGCQPIGPQSGAGDGGNAEGGAGDGSASSADAAPAVVGAGCGTEQKSGATLCVATSKCPSIVIDTQAMPSCGFRVRGSTVDLVCACGTSICPIGIFTTCAEATTLLANQTEASVCVQVSEGRCTELAASSTSSSSSSSTSSSNGGTGCDQQCMKDCGGGAGCASVCNCD